VSLDVLTGMCRGYVQLCKTKTVLSCHITQFLQYNHRPLLTTLLPSSVLPSKLFVHAYTTLAFARPNILTNTEDAALFFSHHTRKFLVQTFGMNAVNKPCCV